MYKGFIIKYVAFIFHDDIIPSEHANGHFHWLEIALTIILSILLIVSFVKILVSSITEFIRFWRRMWNWRETTKHQSS